MAARRSSSTTDYEDFEVGDQVRHPKWGVGSILFKSGSGEATKAIVVFPDQGQKKLLLKFAKLERIQEARPAETEDYGQVEEAPVAVAAPAAAKKSAEPEAEVDAADLPAATVKEWDGEEEEEEEEYDDDDDDDDEDDLP